VEQIGTPQAVYDHQPLRFVYDFLGDVNLFHGRLLAELSLDKRGNNIAERVESVIDLCDHMSWSFRAICQKDKRRF